MPPPIDKGIVIMLETEFNQSNLVAKPKSVQGETSMIDNSSTSRDWKTLSTGKSGEKTLDFEKFLPLTTLGPFFRMVGIIRNFGRIINQ